VHWAETVYGLSTGQHAVLPEEKVGIDSTNEINNSYIFYHLLKDMAAIWNLNNPAYTSNVLVTNM